MTLEDWKTKATEKKASVDKLIPPEWRLPKDLLEQYNSECKVSVIDIPQKLMSPEAYAITETRSSKQLVDRITSGELSAVAVVKAFSQRAVIATQLTNCCTELMFDNGLKRAEFLDNYLKEHGKPFGPLHGLPISIKDSYNVPGFDSTLGYVSYIGNNKDIKQSNMVTILLDLGAVLYVKTNIPQTLMTGDSENNIFGRTLNPNNLTLTAGGSSGGEGSLIKQRGAMIGVGTDIAGSIRIPSLCCGTYGFKPTTNRLPFGEQSDVATSSYVAIEPCAGPLANNFEDLEFFFKAVLDSEPWIYDSGVYPLSYQNTKLDAKLKIGILFEDKNFPIHPPVRKILEDAANKLSEAGHNIIIINDHPSFEEGWKLALSQYCIASPKDLSPIDRIKVSGESFIKSLSQSGIEIYGEVPESIESLIDNKRAQKKIMDDWYILFNSNNLDVLICPGAPSTAPPHDTYGIPPYTSMWNLVDYPACIIPFGKIEQDFEEDLSRYPAKLKGIYAHYEKNTYLGGLGSIQVVAPKLKDEHLLSASKIIDNILNKA